MPTRCNRGFYCRSYCLLAVHIRESVTDCKKTVFIVTIIMSFRFTRNNTIIVRSL